MSLAGLVDLIWRAVLVLVGLGSFIVALFIVTVLIIVAVKAIKKEVQKDDSKDVH